MKSPQKLQDKLLKILKGTPALHVFPPSHGTWTDLDFFEVSWVVQDFVNANPDVIECDPLKDWLEEYRFYLADRKGG